ncbi:hypothetical protein [Aneurinibacillus soli]|uniref:hypothetical protein n=1 Tax=Aneurinibacillus soli TaxID=1500254 RepID=UPI0012FE0B64|nr:hypothetical protein [Aneurinibacillus soli]
MKLCDQLIADVDKLEKVVADAKQTGVNRAHAHFLRFHPRRMPCILMDYQSRR